MNTKLSEFLKNSNMDKITSYKYNEYSGKKIKIKNIITEIIFYGKRK